MKSLQNAKTEWMKEQFFFYASTISTNWPLSTDFEELLNSIFAKTSDEKYELTKWNPSSLIFTAGYLQYPQ